MTAINKHLHISSILGSIFTMFFLCSVTWCGSILCQNIYESLSPTNWRFHYSFIKPIKKSFKHGETLEFETKVSRYNGLNTRREDTAYCHDSDSGLMEKYPTQYRPSKYGYEYKDKGNIEATRKYSYKLDDNELSCKMCGTVIGKTPLGYKKIFTYCTDEFRVNQ